MKWHKKRKPELGKGVLVAVQKGKEVFTWLLTAGWDGEQYVDANGDIVTDVIAWTEIPQYRRSK